MSEEVNQLEWQRAFAIRVWNLAQQKKPVTFRMNGDPIFEFDVGTLLALDDGKLTIELGQSTLKTKAGLVGIAGFFYSATIFWGETVETVTRSWNWLIGERWVWMQNASKVCLRQKLY